MGLSKSLGKLAGGIGAPVKAVGKALGIRELSGGNKLGSVGPGKMVSLVKEAEARNALQEGQARVAPVKAPGMKKGGKVKKGYHRMPDGKIMKDSAHKKKTKAKSRSASSRGDGICRKGKTRGKVC
jgi:hypothetical protein